jgi:prepilin-type N-terminal cleavage/methylation domain-containing protein
MKTQLPRSDSGFTVTELLVGLTLSSIAAAIVFNVFFSTQNSFYDTRNAVDSQAEARVALNLMAQDIRGAGASPVELPFERIAVAESDTIRVLSDLDGNGMIDVGAEPPEDVTWYWNRDDEELVRRTATGEFPIARDITFFGMNFLDADGAELDSFPLDRDERSAVRAVQLFVNVRIEDGVERDRFVTILLRNDDPGV